MARVAPAIERAGLNQPLEDRPRHLFLHAIFQRALHEDDFKLVEQLEGVFAAQGAAQHLALAVPEAGDIVRHFQHLLLPEDDAQGFFQRRFEPLIEVGDCFRAAR